MNQRSEKKGGRGGPDVMYMTLRHVYFKKFSEIWTSKVVEGFECYEQDFKIDTEVDWEPMKLFKDMGDMM